MKNKNITQEQMTTTDLKAPDLGQTHTEFKGMAFSVCPCDL